MGLRLIKVNSVPTLCFLGTPLCLGVGAARSLQKELCVLSLPRAGAAEINDVEFTQSRVQSVHQLLSLS